MTEDLIPVLDPSSLPLQGSKYRRLLEKVLKYFEEHPDVNVVKMIFDSGYKADLAAVKCRLHLGLGENLKIIRRRNEVFFLKEGSL